MAQRITGGGWWGLASESPVWTELRRTARAAARPRQHQQTAVEAGAALPQVPNRPGWGRAARAAGFGARAARVFAVPRAARGGGGPGRARYIDCWTLVICNKRITLLPISQLSGAPATDNHPPKEQATQDSAAPDRYHGAAQQPSLDGPSPPARLLILSLSYPAPPRPPHLYLGAAGEGKSGSTITRAYMSPGRGRDICRGRFRRGQGGFGVGCGPVWGAAKHSRAQQSKAAHSKAEKRRGKQSADLSNKPTDSRPATPTASPSPNPPTPTPTPTCLDSRLGKEVFRRDQCAVGDGGAADGHLEVDGVADLGGEGLGFGFGVGSVWG
jgi:hypothetical protein